MSRVPVVFDTSIESAEAKVQRTELYALLGKFAEEIIPEDIGIDEILIEVAEGHSPRGVPTTVRAKYELRFFELPFSESGTLGHVSVKQLFRTLRMSYDWAMKKLVEEQPNCRFQPVAARVVQHNIARVFHVGSSGGSPEKMSWMEIMGLMSDPKNVHTFADGGEGLTGVGMGHEQHQVRTDFRAVLQIALADLSRGEMRDVWWERTQKERSPMSRYISDPQVALLPKALAAERVAAKELLTGMRDHMALPDDVIDDGPGQAEACSGLGDQEIIDTALALRDGLRLTPSDVSLRLGMTHQALSAVFRRKGLKFATATSTFSPGPQPEPTESP